MTDIPATFFKTIQPLLGADFEAFQASQSEPPITGLRANTLKIAPQELRKRLPYYSLGEVPWAPAGFVFDGAPPDTNPPAPGKHPYHAAGLYYIQEPSAMAVAELLDPQPGELVLDLCAAPGGKTTHLAALMGGQGALVANETHPQRAWELAGNLERCGVRNAAVTRETPERMAETLGAVFDRVLVDAPCSGESMFRRSESARRDWSPALVGACAVRQTAILDQAARLTAPGGRLAYSTCTFNPLENEAVVSRFLGKHPQFKIIQTTQHPGFSPGRPIWAVGDASREDLKHTVRLWPHRAGCEGHFVAVLRRNAEESSLQNDLRKSGNWMECPPSIRKQFTEFCEANLSGDGRNVFEGAGALSLAGNYLYWSPEKLPGLGSLQALHPGWWLGSFQKGGASRAQHFTPSHALAMGLKAGDARRRVDLRINETMVIDYLKGNPLPLQPGEDGWALVTIEGFHLGWGKRVGETLKNHYPRGLRWH